MRVKHTALNQMTKENPMIESIVDAARKPLPQIAELRELEASDGKWYRAFGFPFGVKHTGAVRIAGYAFRAQDGTTYGKRYNSADEAMIAAQQNQDARDAEFRSALLKMTQEELDRQSAYWIK